MTWTVTDDKPGLIFVSAVINTEWHQDQLRDLIAALQKRVQPKPKEKTDDRPADV